MCSCAAAEIGRPDEAFDLFRFATRIDLDNYNRNTGEGIHTTSIAAAWMNIVYGFGGMRSDGPTLSFNPTIPAHWQSYSFQVLYRDSLVRVEVTQSDTVIRTVDGPGLEVLLGGSLREVNADGIRIQR